MKWKSIEGVNCVLGALLVVLILFIGLLCCVPPISRDALIHHLEIPLRYLEHGGIHEIPSLRFSYYPMNLDLLYLIPLYFGDDILPKFIHFSFALLTALLIFNYLKKRIDRFHALLGAILFLSTPIILKLSTTAYVDLGLIFFTTASVVYIFEWIETGYKAKILALSAMFCGLCMGVKYNGLITFFLLVCFVPYLYSVKNPKTQYRGLAHGVLFIVLAVLVFSPWAVRNIIWTDNPIYPLFNTVFDQHTPSISGSETNQPPLTHFVLRHINYNESFLDIMLIPIRIFFQGEDGNPKYFDGRLNPILFILPLLAFFNLKVAGKSRIDTEKKMMLAFSILYILFAFFQRDMRIRYISPTVPFLVILTIYGIRNLFVMLNTIPRQSLYRSLSMTSFFIVIALFSLNLNYALNLYRYVVPIGYLTGEVDKDQYIERYVHEYPVLQFANQYLPEKTTILGLFTGNRGYYSKQNLVFNENLLLADLRNAENSDQLVSSVTKKGISYLLIRYDLFLKWVNDNLDYKQKAIFNEILEHNMKLLYFKNGYGLFSLATENPSTQDVPQSKTDL